MSRNLPATQRPEESPGLKTKGVVATSESSVSQEVVMFTFQDDVFTMSDDFRLATPRELALHRRKQPSESGYVRGEKALLTEASLDAPCISPFSRPDGDSETENLVPDTDYDDERKACYMVRGAQLRLEAAKNAYHNTRHQSCITGVVEELDAAIQALALKEIEARDETGLRPDEYDHVMWLDQDEVAQARVWFKESQRDVLDVEREVAMNTTVTPGDDETANNRLSIRQGGHHSSGLEAEYEWLTGQIGFLNTTYSKALAQARTKYANTKVNVETLPAVEGITTHRDALINRYDYRRYAEVAAELHGVNTNSMIFLLDRMRRDEKKSYANMIGWMKSQLAALNIQRMKSGESQITVPNLFDAPAHYVPTFTSSSKPKVQYDSVKRYSGYRVLPVNTTVEAEDADPWAEEYGYDDVSAAEDAYYGTFEEVA